MTARTTSRSLAAAIRLAALVAAPALLRPSAGAAQELEPRSYSPSPVGANFAVVGYVHSWGSLLFDAAVPIEDARASIHGTALGYARTFGIGGKQALATVVWPYAWGDFTGRVFGSDSSTTRSGAADLKAKLSVNFIGSPAMSPAEFARTPGHPFLAGASVTVSAPTGQYFPSKLINIGTNRWAFKPEVGVSYRVRPRWTAETYFGAWFFAENGSFFPGSVKRTQDPLTSIQAHVTYSIARRTWAALDGTWYWGGSASSNGGPASTRIDNKRLGAVLALGVTPRQSLKLGYSYGAATRVGDDFGTLAVAWQVLWF